jgi:O-antigen ligase
VLNRRTVWLAIVVGVAVLMLRDRRLGRRALVLVALGGVMTAVAFVWLGGLQEGSQPVVQSGSGNLSWRVQSWEQLVTAWSHNSTDWVIGQPVGSGFTREIEGTETNVHPHNFYIEVLIRTGVAGLVALIALTVGLLRALWRTPSRDAGLLGPGVIPALLAMQIIWFLTWVPGTAQGLVTGLAIAVAAALPSRRAQRAWPTSPIMHREPTPTGKGRW